MATTSAASSRSHSRSPSVSGKASPSRPAQQTPGIIRLPNNNSNRNSPRARRPQSIIKRPKPRTVDEPASDEAVELPATEPLPTNDEGSTAPSTSSPSKRNRRRRNSTSTATPAVLNSEVDSSAEPTPSAPGPSSSKSPIAKIQNDKKTSTPEASPVKGKRRANAQSSSTLLGVDSSFSAQQAAPRSIPARDPVPAQSSSSNLSRSAPSEPAAFPAPPSGPNPNTKRGKRQVANPSLPQPVPAAASATSTATPAQNIPRPKSVPLEHAAAWPSQVSPPRDSDPMRTVSTGSSPQKVSRGALTWQQEMMRSGPFGSGSSASTPSSSPNKRRPRGGRSHSGLIPPAPLALGTSPDESSALFAMDDLFNSSPPPETQLDPRSYDPSPSAPSFPYSYSQPTSPARAAPRSAHYAGHSRQPSLQPRVMPFANEPNYYAYPNPGETVFGSQGVRYAAPRYRNLPNVTSLAAPAFIDGVDGQADPRSAPRVMA